VLDWAGLDCVAGDRALGGSIFLGCAALIWRGLVVNALGCFYVVDWDIMGLTFLGPPNSFPSCHCGQAI
jgi:hypothetical protein